ncbi:MAG TPA: dTDP-4-dehydrorhamnose 3,5-epimerase family protein [Candidatus Limnocylindrales bacterium]
MRFTELAVPGVFLIDLEERRDERGFFARTFCAREFADHGLVTRVAQCNLSYNERRGTLRGLHFQDQPAPEAKLVRCLRGAIYMVVVDRRPGSPRAFEHVGVHLRAEERRALYVPELCANGYQALTDGAEVAYQVSEFHTPEAERGMRYDDPRLGIEWPLPVTTISAKDQAWPLLGTEERGT